MVKLKEPFVMPVKPEDATREVKELYDYIQKRSRPLLNILLNMGNSSAVLKGYIGLEQAVHKTVLNPALREQIMLAVSQVNNCDYCLAAHTAIGKAQGLSDEDMIKARKGEALDSKTKAILHFAKSVVEKRGHVSEQEIANLKAAQVTNREFVEVIMVIVDATFTNYFNTLTETPIDFPKAPEI